MPAYSDDPDARPDLLTDYLSPDDLAARLGIARRTLARLHAARKGPPRCVVGRKILYRREAVLAWLASTEVDPRARDRRRR